MSPEAYGVLIAMIAGAFALAGSYVGARSAARQTAKVVGQAAHAANIHERADRYNALVKAAREYESIAQRRGKRLLAGEPVPDFTGPTEAEYQSLVSKVDAVHQVGTPLAHGGASGIQFWAYWIYTESEQIHITDGAARVKAFRHAVSELHNCIRLFNDFVNADLAPPA
jgi:hypothetical protein